MEKPGVYDYLIDARDLDHTGWATFVSLCNYILQAAGRDADLNGFGVRDLNLGNSSWVLSRMCVEFTRKVTQAETLTVETWVSEVGRMMTTRNMIVRIGDEQIGAAVTQWAVIDLDKRTPMDLRTVLDYENKVKDIPSPIEKPAKIHKIEPETVELHRVVYTDIDFNCHVNSMKYIEWMMNMVPLPEIESKMIGRADMNFLHESRYGDNLQVGVATGDTTLFEISAADAVPVCRASLLFR